MIHIAADSVKVVEAIYSKYVTKINYDKERASHFMWADAMRGTDYVPDDEAEKGAIVRHGQVRPCNRIQIRTR